MSYRSDFLSRRLGARVLVFTSSALLLVPLARAAEDALEEVVVTATKRADPISKVPISITALTQEAMDAQGVRSINDIVAQTPGVSITKAAGSGVGQIISIRGISSNAGASTTGVYIDDTPIQARNNAVNFAGTSFPEVFDLERVEILRGPQGTLFGAGAEGGVVRFLSVQPSLTRYTGYSRAEASATDHGTPSGELGVAYGGPIVKDVLGFRVSAWDRHDGGYVDRRSWESSSAESKPDWTNTKVLRAALLYAPTSAVKITPSVQFQEQYTHTPSSYWGQLSNPGHTQFVSGLQLDQPSDDSSTVASLKIEADLGPMTLTSVSSYFHRNNVSLADVKWVGGLFFSQAKEEDTLLQPALGFPAVLQQATGMSFTDFFGAPLLDGIYEYTGDERSTDQQIALFGSVDWRFADHWTLTAGLRVSQTKIDYTEAEGGPEGPNPGGVSLTSGVQKDHPVTPKVGLNWQADEHNLVYASVAKGYRIRQEQRLRFEPQHAAYA
jgi:outer membrane receptor protein involved in Fe transport